MIKANDFSFEGKKALIRVDFNVPLSDSFEVRDNTRIKAAIPTIEKILADGGSVVLMSHLGRPKNGPEDKYSLRHIISELSKLLNKPVDFANDCVGTEASNKVKALQAGQLLLLENLRFYAEEKKGDETFAKQLADLGADVYVNDAFGTAHRAHASTFTVAQYFAKENRICGLLMSKEIENAERVLNNAERPFTAILGGAKVSDKIQLIENLMDRADNILIGGGMAYTFFHALGGSIGKSILEEDKVELAKSLIEKARDNGTQLILPVDSILANQFAADAETKNEFSDEVPADWMALDIGEVARQTFAKHILESKTILWNGPMGVFEMEPFQQGTISVAKAVGKATENGAFSLIGGGDSVSALKNLNLEDQVSYISTGGGAMLKFFEGEELPALSVLS